MISILEWEIRHNSSTVLPVLDGNMTIDDQNIPAITAQVVVPYDAALMDVLDPRQTIPPRVTLRGTQSFWASQTLGDVTAYLAANSASTIADLSALWTGLTTTDVDNMFGTRLHPLAPSEPGRMSMSLHVREVSEDGTTMTIDLASDEALLNDWAVVNLTDVDALADAQAGFNPDYAWTYVNMFLKVVLGRQTIAGPYDTATVSDDFSFSLTELAKGATAWEGVRAALDDADLKLRVHPDGVTFSLERPVNSINPPSVHSFLFTPENTTSVRHVRTRQGDWADSVVLSQSGVPTAGAPSGGVHSRTYREELHAGTTPTPSMAQNIYTRTRNRGLLIDIEAPIRLLSTGGVFMRDEIHYLADPMSEDPAETWVVKSVGYSFGTARMNIRAELPY